MRRAHEREIVDEAVHDQDELEHSRGQVAAVNHFLGGDRSLRRALSPLAAKTREASPRGRGHWQRSGGLGPHALLGRAPRTMDLLIGIIGDTTPARALLRPGVWADLVTSRDSVKC